MDEAMINPHACGCLACRDQVRDGLARRGFLRLAAATAVGVALAPIASGAESSGGYRAMLLSCVDPRTQAPIAEWMDRPVPDSHTIGLRGKYSQFSVAGAAVAVAAPAFEKWRETFWDNLGASIQLHGIRTLLVVDHGDCGALGIAYGQRVLQDQKLELAAHMADVKRLQEELAVRHPDMDLQAWFIDRDAQGAFTEWKSLIAGPVIS
jgi:carbonic anhydrase